MTRAHAIALAVLLIASGTITPIAAAVGTPDANDTGDDDTCTKIEAAIHGGSFGFLQRECSPDYQQADLIREMQARDAEESRLNIYEGGLAVKSQATTALARQDNYLRDSETFAWAKARARAFEAMENDVSEPLTTAYTRREIRNYYATMQQNLLRQSNLALDQIETLEAEQDATNGIEEGYLRLGGTEISDGFTEIDWLRIDRIERKNLTLVNDNDTGVTVLYLKGQVRRTNGANSRTYTMTHRWDPIHGWQHVSGGVDSRQLGIYAITLPTHVRVAPPDDTGDYQPQRIYEFAEWEQANDDIGSTQNRLNENVDAFVDGIHTEVQNGNIDPVNYTDSTVLAQEYATKYDETGHWVYAVASLSQLGYATPDLNGTGTMTVATDGRNHTGLILSQEAPDNGTWATGTTYDPDAIPGEQFLVTTNGEKTALDRPFTIRNMTDREGNDLAETAVQQYDRKTLDRTAYNRLQERLETLRRTIEAREPTTAGGGALPTGSVSPTVAVIVLGGLGSSLLILRSGRR